MRLCCARRAEQFKVILFLSRKWIVSDDERPLQYFLVRRYQDDDFQVSHVEDVTAEEQRNGRVKDLADLKGLRSYSAQYPCSHIQPRVPLSHVFRLESQGHVT
jgi:hypothetical protein